jgi:pilus assembly protein CpaB
MKSKTLILMGVAIVCGLLASYMTSRLLAEREGDSQQAEVEKVKILVAKQSIPYGTSFAEPEKYFVEKAFTRGEEPTKAIRSFDEIRGKWLSRSMIAESHVTKEDLTDKGGIGLQADLAPGMRAIAIRVNAETLAGGFVLPRSRVDVVLTIANEESQIILQDMLVLAVDTTANREEGRSTMIGGTVTLQATPDEAEQLAHAQANGQLRLILRGLGDKESVKTTAKTKGSIWRRSGTSVDRKDDDETTLAAGSAMGGSRNPKFPTGNGTPESATVVKVDDTTTLVQELYNGTDLSRVEFKLDKDGTVISASPDGRNSTPTRIEKPNYGPDTAPQGGKIQAGPPPAEKSQTKEDSLRVKPGK